MSGIVYSPTTDQFYTTAIPYSNMPADVLEITSAEWDLICTRDPQSTYVFDANATPRFTIVSNETIDVQRAVVAEDIRNTRDKKKESGIPLEIDGKTYWFHSDADSRIQFLGLKDIARDLLNIEGNTADTVIQVMGQDLWWKTMSGEFATITCDIAARLVGGISLLDAQLFAVAEQHIAAVMVSNDPSSYDYSAGWPAAYGVA